jgi:hypothetical protein
MDASKTRVSPEYIVVEMQSWPCDGCPFDPRAVGPVAHNRTETEKLNRKNLTITEFQFLWFSG